uniref:Lysozyme n=1 Tax=Caudovirales sp. ctu3532 TaxID=2827639 RepID=A0A8S5TI65_9CAUD|nr:MAG TPA: lysozyme [Caudovirales sp. ctu3532]
MIYLEDTVVEIEAGTTDDETAREIYRNLLVLYGTQTGEQALDREFGIDISILDQPQEAAKALLAAEFVRKTKRYEPRMRVMRVEWNQDNARAGCIVPKVVVSFV